MHFVHWQCYFNLDTMFKTVVLQFIHAQIIICHIIGHFYYTWWFEIRLYFCIMLSTYVTPFFFCCSCPSLFGLVSLWSWYHVPPQERPPCPTPNHSLAERSSDHSSLNSRWVEAIASWFNIKIHQMYGLHCHCRKKKANSYTSRLSMHFNFRYIM